MSEHNIFAISDATGEMAMNIAFAAIRQFTVDNINIIRRPNVTDREKIVAALKEAKRKHAVVVHTFVGKELREIYEEESEREGIISVDIMGPVLTIFEQHLHSTPSEQPGLKYKQTKDYFKRQEASDFAIKHDDGLSLETIDQADILILGISRTSKTPLSVYLAYRGFKVANVPIVKDVTLPPQIEQIDNKKVFGLIIDPERLSSLRESRLIKMGRPLTESYAQLDKVKEELDYSRQIFRKLGVTTVNVTGKSIEEIATEILITMGL